MVSLAETYLGLIVPLLIAGLWFWRASRNISTKYNNELDEVKTYRAGQFRSELNDIVLEILEDVDYEELSEQDDTNPEVITMAAIEENVHRNSLSDMEDALRRFDEIDDWLRKAENKYQRSSKLLLLSATITLSLGIFTVAVPSGQDFVGTAQVIFTGLGAYAVLAAANVFVKGWKAEQNVDQTIRNYSEKY